MNTSMRRAQCVIAAVVVLAALGVGATVLHFGPAGIGSPTIVAVLGVAVFIGWRSPILVYRESESWGYQLDEGYFVVLALVAQPLGMLLAFGLATAASQISLRRSPIKALFNVSLVLLSCCVGVAVVHAIGPTGRSIGPLNVFAGAVGAVCYEVTNAAGISGLLASLRQGRLAGVVEMVRRETLLVWSAIALGSVGALAVQRRWWAVVLLLLAFMAFRVTLAASFRAIHDHARLRGLFSATLKIQRGVGEDAVVAILCQEVRTLLLCSSAEVVLGAPPDRVMVAEMTVGQGSRWLVAGGREATAPFDDADQGLLEALAAVGAAQLEAAALYEERRREQERVATITANLGEGVCAFDTDGRLTFVNPAARALLDLGEGFEIGPVAPAALSDLIDPALRVMATGGVIESERGSFMRTDGTLLPVEFTCTPIRTPAGIDGAVVTFRDISERLAFEEQLEFHAFRDVLTGLPNRRVFLDRLEHALYRAERSGELLAVFFIDVDRFKVVNDSLGHQAGDQLLISIAERLQSLTRPEDSLARFGGDEFTLLIEGVSSPATAEAVAQRMLETVHQPMVVEGERSVVATISIGIAMATGASSPDDVLHNADVAMYQAKRRRAGQYAVFDAEAMATRSAERVDLETALRRAISSDELRVYYQPLFASKSGDVVGAEALVRWQHPERGLLPPSEFIALAEETGLVLELGELVLGASCRMARYWHDHGARQFTISVNLSAQQFQDPALVEKIAKAIRDAGVGPEHLCLEITESLALHDIERSILTLGELKALGVRLAIDDFGTGYSSLTYLKRFPVDVVKLDQTFVQDLAVSAVDAAIVLAVVELARNLGLVAVAEGVETAEQMARLTEMGCPVLQGYLLARPMSPEDFSEMLDGWPEVAALS